MDIGDDIIHFWKCTQEDDYDKLEIREIDLNDDEMKDKPSFENPFYIKRKEFYSLAGVVINKPFV